MKHWDKKQILSLLFIGTIISSALGITLVMNYANSTQKTASTKAAETVPECKCNDQNVCYPDGCSRKPKDENNKFDESRYNMVCKQFDPGYRMPDRLIQHFCSAQQPSCCFDIYKYKDDRLCCFQERWTCHPSLCEGSTGNGDCGKYWGLPNNFSSYGCVKKDANGKKVPNWGLPPNLPGGNSNPTATPTSTPRPTTPPAPTATPTNSSMPTAIPTQPPTNPTQQLSPTAITPTQPGSTTAPIATGAPTTAPTTNNNQPDSFPTSIPEITSSPTPAPTIDIKTPQELVREVITYEKVETLNKVTELPLGAVKTGVNTVKSYDKKLEMYVEGWIFRIRIELQKLFP